MSEKKETVLKVEGMSCPSCISHIDAALRDVEGVEGVEVQLKQGQVRVQHEAGAGVSAFIEALRDAGYDSKQTA